MTLVLVEGPSDANAIETLARLRGVDPSLAAVRVESLDGITNLGRRLADRDHERVLVLHDDGESAHVQRIVERSGAPVELHVCVADLEDELIRALGVSAVLDVVARAGDLEQWTTLIHQPFHRERPAPEVLRRFMGTTSGRKVRYAGLLVAAAVEVDGVPAPLEGLLASATGG